MRVAARRALALALCVCLAVPPQAQGGRGEGVVGGNVITVPAETLSPEGERRAHDLGMRINCPVCRGESIAQSQTPIAREMMNEVRAGVREGLANREILSRFEAAYGERILLEPPRRGINWLLWGLPGALLAFGGLTWYGYLRRAAAPPEALSAEDEARVARLLRERGGR